jgi:integrase
MPLLYIAITTGLRWSELAGLQIRDVELMGKKPMLNVNRGLHSTSKGITYEKPKSSAGKRTIPLTETQVELIAAHIAETKRTMVNGEEPLFISPEGHVLNYSNFRNRVFIPALQKACISKARIHDLRRTTATILVANQVDLKTIEQLMGHSDIRITLSAYASATEAGLSKATNALEGYLKGANEGNANATSF